MEYIKEPNTIDQAVFEGINFHETRRKSAFREAPIEPRHKKATRRINAESQSEKDEVSSSEETDEANRINRRSQQNT